MQKIHIYIYISSLLYISSFTLQGKKNHLATQSQEDNCFSASEKAIFCSFSSYFDIFLALRGLNTEKVLNIMKIDKKKNALNQPSFLLFRFFFNKSLK